ncbi:AEC family transporter [Streptococcus ruminantium]|uniref:AEC family transporter n=1 Tax=Streptococcus ruminantium TaxID=1917441 RepID=UPI0012DC657D|nr:transporter [Streptococcus ruminantium]
MAEILIRALGFLLVIALGYMLKLRKVVRREDAGIFSAIVMNVTLPCTILVSASSVQLGEGLLIPLLFGFAMNLVMDGIGYWEARGRGSRIQSIGLVQISGYNIGTFILPFVQAFFPVSYPVPVLLFDAGNALMVLGGNYTLAVGLDSEREKMRIASIVRNLFGSIPFAVYLPPFTFSSLNLQIPSRILSITPIAASANPFLAMLMLGILFDLKLDRKKIGRLIYLLCLRLCINILIGSIFYFLLPIDRMMKIMLLICLASPISVMSPVYALKLGSYSAEPANLNSLSILVSLVLMMLLIFMFA